MLRDQGSGDWFGPELRFGNAIEESLHNQAPIFEIAWGAKSLNTDLREPTSAGTRFPTFCRFWPPPATCATQSGTCLPMMMAMLRRQALNRSVSRFPSLRRDSQPCILLNRGIIST